MAQLTAKDLAAAARHVGREITAREIDARMRKAVATGRQDKDMDALACLAGLFSCCKQDRKEE
jgi:hypothetical protein